MAACGSKLVDGPEEMLGISDEEREAEGKRVCFVSTESDTQAFASGAKATSGVAMLFVSLTTRGSAEMEAASQTVFGIDGSIRNGMPGDKLSICGPFKNKIDSGESADIAGVPTARNG